MIGALCWTQVSTIEFEQMRSNSLEPLVDELADVLLKMVEAVGLPKSTRGKDDVRASR